MSPPLVTTETPFRVTAETLTDTQIATLHAEAKKRDDAALVAGRAVGHVGVMKHFVTMMYCGLACGVITSETVSQAQARAHCADLWNKRGRT